MPSCHQSSCAGMTWNVLLPAGLGSPGAGSGRSGHNAWRHGGAGPGEGRRRNTKKYEDMTISDIWQAVMPL